MAVSETIRERKCWRNDAGNQRIYPLRQIAPSTIEELCDIVNWAERESCTVRAAGSGHSWSDVALTDGVLVRPEGLTRPLALDPAANPHRQ